ncbi:sensor histidine kinase [Sphingomonas morindae]|uniref:histidine kinase n=1 Tax=Sphingomonas morindae TaxID=1541170 RepID=A0ABY4XAG7_9SPHN|nr:sensor histidine kinase [Sphingomonas morindae]USI73962.1 CHASE3 domain-containing protein [Sphingomonas morindae]
MLTALQETARSERRVSRLVLTCALLGFLALFVAAGVAAWSVLQAQDHARWVEHTYRVQQRISALRTAVERKEAARRGFLLDSTPSRRQLYDQAAGLLPRLVVEVERLTVDNPAQQTNSAELGRLIRQHDQMMQASLALALRDPLAARARFDEDGSRDVLAALRQVTAQMLFIEEQLLHRRVAEQRRSVTILFVALGVAAVLLVVVAVFSIVTLRNYTSGLIKARLRVEELNDELEDRVEERTRDLTRANEEIQRFAYIVSHDLRSPLVNVMGFTGELEAATKPLAALVDAAEAEAPAILSEEARLAAREDLPESIRFIRSSTQKMDRLINAILKLSREGKRVLAPETIDLGTLADGIVASLAHRLEAIGATIEVVRPMPSLVADRLAVEQMLSNLVENAVKYLKPGRPGRIILSAETHRGRIDVKVADNGRGIDPRDHDRIFDLFRRSGTQDQPGEGIGLAHVRALAYRMGGLVECQSALGEGATFTLSLPATPLSSQG